LKASWPRSDQNDADRRCLKLTDARLLPIFDPLTALHVVPQRFVRGSMTFVEGFTVVVKGLTVFVKGFTVFVKGLMALVKG
jgi:hypothetical protein